jgi:hypothetical protein
MVGLVLGGLLLSPISPRKKLLAVALLGGATALFQGLAYVTEIGGVRLLKLAAFAAPLVALRLAEGLNEREIRRLTLALALAGVLGRVFNQKNFWEDWGGEADGDPNPLYSLPYGVEPRPLPSFLLLPPSGGRAVPGYRSHEPVPPIGRYGEWCRLSPCGRWWSATGGG